MDERLGTLLVQSLRLRPDQLDEALRRQKERGGRLGTNLVEMGALSLDVVCAALASQRQVPVATANELEAASSAALALLPAQTAARLLAVPLSAGTAGVVVAAASPWDMSVVGALSQAIGRLLLLKVAPELRILEYLEKLYRVPNPRKKAAGRPLPAAAAPVPALFEPLAVGAFLGAEEDDPSAAPPTVPGPIPGLEPIVAPPLPLSGALASPLMPTMEVSEISMDAFGASPVEPVLPMIDAEDALVEVLPGELVAEEEAPVPPSAPIARAKTPIAIGPVSLSDPLASMSSDLPGAASPALAPAPPAAPTPAPVATVAEPQVAPEPPAPAPAVPELATPERAPAPPIEAVPPATAPVPVAVEPEDDAWPMEVAAPEPAPIPVAAAPTLDAWPMAEPPAQAAPAPEPVRPPEPAPVPVAAAPTPVAAPAPAPAPEPVQPPQPAPAVVAPPATPPPPVAPAAVAAPAPAALPVRGAVPALEPRMVELAESPSAPLELAAPVAPAASEAEPGAFASAMPSVAFEPRTLELAEEPSSAPLELAFSPAAAAPAPTEAAPAADAESAWNFPVPSVRPVTSFYLVEDALLRATRPEKVVESLLWACEGRFEAAVFFVLDGKRARARDSFGPSGPVHFDDGFAIDLATPSLVHTGSERQRPVLEAPSSPADAALCARMGVDPKGTAAVVPFLMHGSVVSALWASCGSLGELGSLAEDVERLADMGARAFARLPWGHGKG